MGTFSEYFSLVMLLVTGLFYGLKSQAGYSPTSNELYSDTLYIQRSSAEVPRAFESAEREELASNDVKMESDDSALPMVEETRAHAPKKVAKLHKNPKASRHKKHSRK